MSKVAVYGSLRAGMHNHGLLVEVGAKQLGAQRAEGFNMVSLGGYPAVYEAVGDITIEVYDVAHNEKEAMQRLDWLEGYPGFYNRKLIETRWGPAWIYYMKQQDCMHRRPVPEGDWVAHYGVD
jgi:gamma-glutamylcyclotransferase (GGCT)/AIG2-like uncharacterized protein YtfP